MIRSWLAGSLVASGLLLTAPSPAPAAHPQAAARPDSATNERKGLPLEPSRTVAFTTEEGSWISLDVSSDGRLLVFDLLGDLYTLPIQGGRAVRLTSGMAFDAQPRFSPDGKRVVFVSDRDGGENVWIIDLATRDTTQVTTGKSNRYLSPEWTPDGEYIVASRAGMRTGVPKLWLFHRDGGRGVQLLTEPDNLKAIGAAFGPDGRYIWFAQRTGDWQYNAIFPQYQLAVYDRETGRRYVRSSRHGSGIRPTLSPDGKWLVYGTRHDAETGLRLRNLQDGQERWLAYPVQRDDQESRGSLDVLPVMSFTPDSRELAVSYGGKIWRVPVDGGKPIAVPFVAEVHQALGPKLAFKYPVPDSAQFTVRQIRDAVPSPDGKRLAFVALDRLYVMDFPGGPPRRLTNHEITEAQPAWAPDGQSIAYVTWSSEGGHIYAVRISGGSGPRRLTA